MHRAVDGIVSNDGRHSLLDPFALDLDVHASASRYGVEDLSERRNANFLRQPNRPELRECQFGNGASGVRVGAAGDYGVMVDDDFAVGRRVDVELDRIGASFEGSSEGGKGVLGKFPRRSTVPDALDWTQVLVSVRTIFCRSRTLTASSLCRLPSGPNDRRRWGRKQ